MPGGALSLSAVVERRREHNNDYIYTYRSAAEPTAYLLTPEASQVVKSGYIEVRAPIIASSNSHKFARELELMGSVRRDKYDTRWASGGLYVSNPDGPFPSQEY